MISHFSQCIILMIVILCSIFPSTLSSRQGNMLDPKSWLLPSTHLCRMTTNVCSSDQCHSGM
jgi:hypothetical protein